MEKLTGEEVEGRSGGEGETRHHAWRRKDGTGSGERGSISCEVADFCSPESEVSTRALAQTRGRVGGLSPAWGWD